MPPMGDAGEDRVVAPEAQVDGLEGRGHTVRAVGQGTAFLADSRSQHKGHPMAGASPQVPFLPSLTPSPCQYLLIRGASTKGVWSWESNSGGEQWLPLFSKISLRGMTASRVRWAKEVGLQALPLLWPEQLHFT